VALGPTEEILGAYAPERLIRRPRTLLMPGFVDAHCHMELSVLRGLAQDTGHWMMYGLNPFKGSVSPRDRLWGFRLGVLEALAAGTTTLGNYDDLMHQEAALVEEMGLRGNLTQLVREMPERVYAPGELYRFDEAYGRRDLENLLDLFDRWDGRGDGRIRILFGPMGPDFLGEALLGEVREQALRRGTRVHLHWPRETGRRSRCSCATASAPSPGSRRGAIWTSTSSRCTSPTPRRRRPAWWPEAVPPWCCAPTPSASSMGWCLRPGLSWRRGAWWGWGPIRPRETTTTTCSTK
jgi:hypothetical protein